VDQCKAAAREAAAALGLLPNDAPAEKREEIQALLAAFQSGNCAPDSQ